MNISIPHLLFGSLIAGLIGSLVHLVLGGKPLRLLFSLIFAWIGFWAGHSIANRYHLYYLSFGTINLGGAIFFSIILSLAGYWISGENRQGKE